MRSRNASCDGFTRTVAKRVMETAGALSRTPWITLPIFGILLLVTVSIHMSFVQDLSGINLSAKEDRPPSGSQVHAIGGGHIIEETQLDGVWFREAIWKREFGRTLSRCWDETAGANIAEVRCPTTDACFLLVRCRQWFRIVSWCISYAVSQTKPRVRLLLIVRGVHDAGCPIPVRLHHEAGVVCFSLSWRLQWQRERRLQLPAGRMPLPPRLQR